MEKTVGRRNLLEIIELKRLKAMFCFDRLNHCWDILDQDKKEGSGTRVAVTTNKQFHWKKIITGNSRLRAGVP